MMNINFKTAMFLWFLVIFGCVGFAIYSLGKIEERAKEQYLEKLGSEPNAPICLKMYNSLEIGRASCRERV